MLNRTAVWVLVVAMLGMSAGIVYTNWQTRISQPSSVTTPGKGVITEPIKKTDSPIKIEELPNKAAVNVPFYPQAPFAVWDDIHNEACEEASFLMVRDYYQKRSMDLPELDQTILSFINYQTQNGYKYDITLAELVTLAKRYFSFSGGRIIDEPTIDDIRQAIASGHPVIAPASGRMLDNPNFRSPGPLYHMVVIKGYDSRGFITNDPGTRKGNGFRYSYDNLYAAIHDWNPSDINKGAKRVLVFDKTI